MRKLMLSHPLAFPSPVHGGSSSVWHLVQVLAFLQQRKHKPAKALVEVARAAMGINIARERELLYKQMEKKIREKIFA